MEKSNIHMMLHPERYGMEMCLHCAGYGSSLHEDADTCTKCGGSGLVKTMQRRRLESMGKGGTNGI